MVAAMHASTRSAAQWWPRAHNPEEAAMMETHDEVMQQKQLPRVGQIVRSKKYGTKWRVMEKREVWQHTADDPETLKPRMLPGIYLSYWRVREGVLPGVGKMLGYVYTLHDNTFENNWEVVP